MFWNRSTNSRNVMAFGLAGGGSRKATSSPLRSTTNVSPRYLMRLRMSERLRASSVAVMRVGVLVPCFDSMTI